MDNSESGSMQYFSAIVPKEACIFRENNGKWAWNAKRECGARDFKKFEGNMLKFLGMCPRGTALCHIKSGVG